MIKSLYINNYRCFADFTLSFGTRRKTLLLGRNGSGKSSLFEVISIFQKVCCGYEDVGQLIKSSDFSLGRVDVPIRIVLTLDMDDKEYIYSLAFQLPPGSRKPRVFAESLKVDGDMVFSRELAQLSLLRKNGKVSEFMVDWHRVALPIIQVDSQADPIARLRAFLRRMVLVAPSPCDMNCDSRRTNEGRLVRNAENIVERIQLLWAQYPASYATFVSYLKDRYFFDLESIGTGPADGSVRNLIFNFGGNACAPTPIPFDALSDGEKCIVLAAYILVFCQHAEGTVFCYWDEPDNFLSISDITNFISRLRKGLGQGNGQLIISSHNPWTIQTFPHEEISVLTRDSHLEPVRQRDAEFLKRYERDPAMLMADLLTGDLYGE